MSYVTKINTDSSGKAISVFYFDVLTETEYEQPGDIFVLGAFELNNVRLMLLSGIGEAYNPDTETGVVGRDYTYQGSTASVGAFFPKMRFWNNIMGNSGMTMVSDAFGTYLSPHRIKEMDKIGPIGAFAMSVGGGGSGPIATVSGIGAPPTVQGARNWGADWKKWVLDTFPGRTITIGGSAQSPAYRQNYLDLDPTFRDAYGLPVLRMTFNWTENENKMFQGAYEVRKPIMEALMAEHGGERMSKFAPQRSYAIGPYQSTHNTGGAIMGDNPRTSAVNKYQQVWGSPNVWVVGASAFPQNYWMNPTGAVWALAYMAADSIIDQYLKAPGPLVQA
jgi:gluconate 2-dehydrogenase alpha chain